MRRKLTFPVVVISLLALAGSIYAQCSVPQGQTEMVTSSVSCGQMSIAGTLIIESTGSITGTENSTLNGSGATITVNGGSFAINGRFNVGQGSDGYINLNGGTFTVTGTFKFPDEYGGVHRIYLNDGIMHCGDIEQKHDRDAIIYVGGGILRLDDITGGDRDPQVWKDNGDLLPAEGYDEIVIEDKGTYTEITALPSGPMLQFETAASEGLESVSPAVLTVTLSNAEEGQTYTVDYAAVGGTATGGGVDYTLTPDTLTFNPGQTSLPIEFAVINDGINEDDETVIVELSNPVGPNALLGSRLQHTYTILDPRPGVAFDTATSSGFEDVTPVTIAVSLSSALGEAATVDYAVTGGTATGGGTDYTLMGSGTLTFVPWDTSETISMSIVDDSIEEIPSETVELTLSNPSSNVKLSLQNQHTYTIVDNEAGVVWDGLVWYYSENSGGPFVNDDGDLEWDPEKEGQFITRIPAQDISDVDDVVEISYWLLTDGDHDCPDCFGCDPYCLDDDITCIAGTSDFRFGMFEADGEYITSDGMGHNNSMFVGYKGYNWRFGPNMLAGPTRWVEYCKGDDKPEVHKTGNFAKKPIDSDSLMSINEGLEDYIPGFECPPGTWSLLTLRLKRTSSSSIEMLITYNDRTYTWTDSSGDDQPSKIDVFGVHMRNGRPYSRLVLESLWRPPPEAWDPSPVDGAVNQSEDVVLTWQAGDCLMKHLVYLGDDYNAVLNATSSTTGIFRGYRNPGLETFDPDVDGIDPQPLELDKTYYWRIDEYHRRTLPGCEQFPLITKGEVWSFTIGCDITPASSPSPADGADDVDPNVVLSWSPGANASSHDVYFGTNFDDLNDANTSSSVYQGRQSLDDNTYDPCSLEWGVTYYWRIDELDDDDTSKGDVWSFTVRGYIIVDDMEEYNYYTNIITDTWQAWPYPDPNNGVFVMLEEAIVHSGEQAMDFIFDTSSGTYFTATRTYSTAQDWTVHGVNHLSLWFYGYSLNSTGQMYVILKDGSGHSATVAYAGDMNDIKQEQWQEWNILLQNFSDGSVNLTDVHEVVIGADNVIGIGVMLFDDIRLYLPRCIPEFRPAADITGDCIVNFKDFAVLGSQWLQSPGSPSADIAPDPLDEFVNMLDLAFLADGWLEGLLCP